MENLYYFPLFVPQREEKRLKSLRNDTVWRGRGFERFVVCALLGYITRRPKGRAYFRRWQFAANVKKEKVRMVVLSERQRAQGVQQPVPQVRARL